MSGTDYRCDDCIKYPCEESTNYTTPACVNFAPEDNELEFRVKVQEAMIEILFCKIIGD